MHQEIEEFIRTFNRYSLEGNVDELSPMLHDQVVFVAPSLKDTIKGKDLCLDSIRSYTNQAKTISYEVLDHDITRWSNTVAVIMEYEIEYELNEDIYKERGAEHWILIKVLSNWKMSWRSLMRTESLD